MRKNKRRVLSGVLALLMMFSAVVPESFVYAASESEYVQDIKEKDVLDSDSQVQIEMEKTEITDSIEEPLKSEVTDGIEESSELEPTENAGEVLDSEASEEESSRLEETEKTMRKQKTKIQRLRKKY